MATVWKKASKGIRYKEHESRKHGKRPDRYYSLAYRLHGKSITEGVGWSSDGVKQEDCEKIMLTLRENQRNGTGPQTLKELRQSNIDQNKSIKAEQEKAASLTLQGVFHGGYLAHEQAKGKSEASLRNEKGLMLNYVAPFFGDMSIYAIDARVMDNFFAFLNEQKSVRTKKPLSNGTKKHTLNLVSQVFSYAISRIDNNLQNPVRLIKKPRSDDARQRFLTVDEAKTLLAALAERSKKTHDMALLSLFAGLRVGEILALQWSSINFDEKTIFLKDTKNKNNRHAYMTPEIEMMLKERYAEKSPLPPADERLFSGSEVSNSFERTVKTLGFNEGREDRRDRVVFHTLRHTFASWHAKAGTPLYTIGKLLGHKTLEMTQRYAHLCPHAERQAAMTLHGVLE